MASGTIKLNSSAVIIEGTTPATTGHVVWNNASQYDLSNKWLVGVYILTSESLFYISQGAIGSVAMNPTTHRPDVFVASTAEELWKNKPCYAVYM